MPRHACFLSDGFGWVSDCFMIFHLTSETVWHRALAEGRFTPPAADLSDGFLHFSTAGQLRESAERHARDRADLCLICVDETVLGADLKWEVSRNGQEFPHLYGSLPMQAVIDTRAIALDADGVPIIPDDVFTFTRESDP